MQKYSNRNFMVIIVTFFYWFALYSYTSYLTPLADSIGASATMTGLIVSSYGLAMMICRIPIGLLSDRLNRRKLFVILGSLFIMISAVGLSFAETAAGMLFFRTLAGVGVSTWVVVTVLYDSYFPPEQSQKALADINLMSKVGTFAAGLVGAAFVALLSTMRGAVYAAAIVGTVGFILSFFIKDTRAENKEPAKLKELLLVVKNKNVLFAGISFCLLQLVLYATGMSFASELAYQIGATNFQVGVLNSVMSIAGVISGFLLPRFFLKHINEKILLIISNIVAGVSCVLFPFMNNIYEIYVLEFLCGFVSAFAVSICMAIAVRSVPESKKSSAMGVYQAIYAFGIFIGPTICGVFIDAFDFSRAFILMSLFAVTNIIFHLCCYKRMVLS